MLNPTQTEDMINLLYQGFDIELISFEFEIPIEELEKCQIQLDIRKSVKKALSEGRVEEAVNTLTEFINNEDYNIVERLMLQQITAFRDKNNIDNSQLEKLRQEATEIGFKEDLNNILEKLEIKIPKVELIKKDEKKKRKKNKGKKHQEQELAPEKEQEKPIEEPSETKKNNPNYEQVIENYKKRIAEGPKDIINLRNLLAYAYYCAGKNELAKEVLLDNMTESGSFKAYQLMILIEKSEGNFDDAKGWAKDALEKFPNSIQIRKQLILIAREEGKPQEILRLAKEILSIDSNNEESKKIIHQMSKER